MNSQNNNSNQFNLIKYLLENNLYTKEIDNQIDFSLESSYYIEKYTPTRDTLINEIINKLDFEKYKNHINEKWLFNVESHNIKSYILKKNNDLSKKILNIAENLLEEKLMIGSDNDKLFKKIIQSFLNLNILNNKKFSEIEVKEYLNTHYQKALSLANDYLEQNKDIYRYNKKEKDYAIEMIFDYYNHRSNYNNENVFYSEICSSKNKVFLNYILNVEDKKIKNTNFLKEKYIKRCILLQNEYLYSLIKNSISKNELSDFLNIFLDENSSKFENILQNKLIESDCFIEAKNNTALLFLLKKTSKEEIHKLNLLESDLLFDDMKMNIKELIVILNLESKGVYKKYSINVNYEGIHSLIELIDKKEIESLEKNILKKIKKLELNKNNQNHYYVMIESLIKKNTIERKIKIKKENNIKI